MTWYVVDGMDGSGKSTTADIIAERLRSQGRKVAIMTHPNRDTRVGRLELRFLRMDGKAAVTMSTIFYILDVLHSLSMKKRRKYRECDDVVFVRYIMAVAYLPDSLCGKAYRAVEHVLPMPDVAILVDVTPERAMERIALRGEELETFETVAKLDKVRNRMIGLSEGWTVLDNDGDAESLRRQIDDRVFGGSE